MPGSHLEPSFHSSSGQSCASMAAGSQNVAAELPGTVLGCDRWEFVEPAVEQGEALAVPRSTHSGLGSSKAQHLKPMPLAEPWEVLDAATPVTESEAALLERVSRMLEEKGRTTQSSQTPLCLPEGCVSGSGQNETTTKYWCQYIGKHLVSLPRARAAAAAARLAATARAPRSRGGRPPSPPRWRTC